MTRTTSVRIVLPGNPCHQPPIWMPDGADPLGARQASVQLGIGWFRSQLLVYILIIQVTLSQLTEESPGEPWSSTACPSRGSATVRRCVWARSSRRRGWSGWTRERTRLSPAARKQEFRQILSNLGRWHGQIRFPSTFRDLASATIYVTAFHRFPEVNAVWDARFSGDAPSARREPWSACRTCPSSAQVEAEFLFYRGAPGGGRP